jgi:hypothetical protein
LLPALTPFQPPKELAEARLLGERSGFLVHAVNAGKTISQKKGELGLPACSPPDPVGEVTEFLKVTFPEGLHNPAQFARLVHGCMPALDEQFIVIGVCALAKNKVGLIGWFTVSRVKA